MSSRWCRWCAELVILEGGDSLFSRAVHVESGREECANGERLAAPTDTDPALTAIARRVRPDYPDFDIVVCFGFFRALLSGDVTALPVEASDEAALRAGLNGARSLRKWALADRQRLQVART